LRLPPMNLLPLSTPTAARIAANYPAPSQELDERHVTPPPKRNYTKTPSTPMTASKATFFGQKHEYEDEDQYDLFKRSASSTHMISNDQHGSRSFGLSPTTPVAIPSPFPRNNAHTPFASSSLPKPTADFGPLALRPGAESHTQQLDGKSEVLPSPKPQTLLVK
jgi:dual specificity tyrosine-phosphorylation-regulated kinase 2/3/4